jgi:hypothetical protein
LLRNSGRKTGAHFSWTCFSRLAKLAAFRASGYRLFT